MLLAQDPLRYERAARCNDEETNRLAFQAVTRATVDTGSDLVVSASATTWDLALPSFRP